MKQQLEQELIDWCAPTLAGLKPANLFRCPASPALFLGYPLRDVVGFICNKGQNYSCCGHWKSYGDAEQAQQTFDAYKKCTACYQHMYEKGVPLLKLIAAA